MKMNDERRPNVARSFRPRWNAAGYAKRGRKLRATAIALGLCMAAPLVAQDYVNDKPPPPRASEKSVPLTAEQKTALEAVDIRIAGIEALLPKIADEKFKAGTVSAIADLRRRRKALEKNFDPATYETLMHTVISRYQVVALWLKPPRIPAPAAPATK